MTTNAAPAFRFAPLALIALAISGLSLASATPAEAAKAEIYTGLFSNTAAGGYDVVAYFKDGAPVKGTKEFNTDWKGAEWRFASAENLADFKADPDAFAPQYGGYCAWAAAQGYTAPGDPQIWTLHNDKLYLNYSAKVQADWLKDIDGFIAKADENWPGILE